MKVYCRLREDGEKHGKEDRLIPVPPLTEDTPELTRISKDEDVEELAIAKKTRRMGDSLPGSSIRHRGRQKPQRELARAKVTAASTPSQASGVRPSFQLFRKPVLSL